MISEDNSPINDAIRRKYAQQIANYRGDIFLFIKDIWGFVPQEPKPEFKEKWEEVLRSTGDLWEELKTTVRGTWFGDCLNDETNEWVWYGFKKGTHVTWQQTLIFAGVNKGKSGDANPSLSVSSGHGIGKSMTLSIIVLWFLYCWFDAQVPVTAPTAHQMHDVLWKELSIWIERMPENVKEVYDWQRDYLRIRYSPTTWFARARTATKENTEAIAGVHSDNVLIAVDEASGVPEQVYNTAEGALTSGNVLVVLISNPTRLTGYFFDSHNKNKEDWQRFQFNCEESPVVDNKYIMRQRSRHGRDSDEYRIRVKGEFPGEDMMDDSGYLQLMPVSRILVNPVMYDTPQFLGRVILGIDPSGEGKDRYTAVARDIFHAEVVDEMVTTNSKLIAQRALTLIDRFQILPEDVVVDAFGVGADVGKYIALGSGGKYDVYTPLVGNHPEYEEQFNGNFFQRMEHEYDDNKKDLYLNLRALMFFRGRKWLMSGGYLIDHNPEKSGFANEIGAIKYLRSMQGNKIQLMSKKEMSKLRIPSPNKADAWALTFLRDIDGQVVQTREEIEDFIRNETAVDNPFAVI